MSEAVIHRNSRQGQEPPAPPMREDGLLYPYCMAFDGDKYLAYADTPEDLLAVLVQGYTERDDQGKLEARIRLAIDAQVRIQAVINAETDPDVWNALSEEDRAILTGPRFEQPRVDFWEPEVTLVLVESGYAPYTDINRPISGIADVQEPPNMLWLRPLDEWDFLESLAKAGFIRLHEAVDL